MGKQPSRALGASRGKISTGVMGLDDVLGGGLRPSRLYLALGDPGVGKTTLALQFLLERPFRKLTLVTAFEAALRARRRQYQMRDLTRALLRAEQERAQADALRRSEALYRALARNYPNGAVLLVDRALRCTLAEGQGLASLGISQATAEGRPLAEVLPRALREHLEQGCLHAALAGETTTAEVALDARSHLVHCVPLPGPSGEIEAAMIVTQDITAQKRAEEELRRDAEFRERFLGVLAHDLRTPLRAVAFLADAINRTAQPVGVRRCAERIQRAADRMGRMIGDLLDLTRSRQGGGIPLALKKADLAAICRRTIEELQAAHPQRTILLDARGDATGAWDADRLSQVVSNLVGNALSYSSPSTPVLVELRAADGEVELAVHNRGAPIPPEAIPTLFVPFNRGPHDEDDPRARHGLGLGLFIVDGIVRAHGGTIRVTSTAAEGTTFTVTLPRQAPLPQPTCAASLAAREPGRVVLIVEDDDDIRSSLHEMLVDAGYAPLIAANGREALDVLAKGARPCLILLDLMMPVMNGWELLDSLAADRELSRLPVVIVSAATDDRNHRESATRWLPKPFQAQKLLDTIEEHCAPARRT